MPKGIYAKDYKYRKTEKLKEGMMLLRAHDRDFKLQPSMTNTDVYEKLKEFGFRYSDGMWIKPHYANGYAHAEPIQPELMPAAQENALEVILEQGDVSKVQEIISAMQTLGFQVEVSVTGKKG